MAALVENIKLRDLSQTKFTLNRDEVHLWQASLAHDLVEGFYPSLSAEEIARADRFHFQKDRSDFIVARGLVRHVLGAYLNSKPDQVRFGFGEKGKPQLASDHPIKFNLAHSHALMLLAITPGRAIGVDLELIREDLETEKIAERFFSTAEKVALREVAAEDRRRAFFNCWTRKEAYLKARGDALLPLDWFDVPVDSSQAVLSLPNESDPAEASRWSMQSLDVGAEYAAALVVEGNNWRLRSFVLD